MVLFVSVYLFVYSLIAILFFIRLVSWPRNRNKLANVLTCAWWSVIWPIGTAKINQIAKKLRVENNV